MCTVIHYTIQDTFQSWLIDFRTEMIEMQRLPGMIGTGGKKPKMAICMQASSRNDSNVITFAPPNTFVAALDWVQLTMAQHPSL